MLWFDVEKNGYTAAGVFLRPPPRLWFDVEKNGYTAFCITRNITYRLWFDVEKNGYTAQADELATIYGCGLM